ncbi:MAG: HEAT repeat domain-containing protein [Planctomycetes bacterium]|nr:HEAT repeat domain-containing protein [Planctomycetota bacterium]
MPLDDAFQALKTYDWGTDRAPVTPITEAVAAAQSNAEARQDLESRLLAALSSDISRDAKDFVCRMLTIVGSTAAISALAALLPDEQLSHMARYALERITGPEASQALRDALPKLAGKLKLGAIGSLGVRRDSASVSALANLLKDADPAVARAAAQALGLIGTPAAAHALLQAQPAAPLQAAVTDATLACAEAILAANDPATALKIYQTLAADTQPRLVRLAATRGQLACAARTA